MIKKRMGAQHYYWRALARGRECISYLDTLLKPYYCPLQQRNNHGIFAVNINAQVGFFAHLSWCLYIFAHCQRYNLIPHVVLSSPFYALSKGEDWFSYYFDNRKLTEEDRKKIAGGLVRISHISDVDQLGLPGDPDFQLTLENAHTLFEGNMRIKSDMLEYVQFFVDKHFTGRAVLGIHYRGTDKKHEAKPISWEYCAQTISAYLAAHPGIEVLFVASDEAAFIQWIGAEFKHMEVIYHDDQERSMDGKAIHVQPAQGNNFTKGKEALVNCLLLSRCNALIRTASFLSAWSSIFNPELPVVMLNSPYLEKLWFPDDLIIKKSLNAYLPRAL